MTGQAIPVTIVNDGNDGNDGFLVVWEVNDQGTLPVAVLNAQNMMIELFRLPLYAEAAAWFAHELNRFATEFGRLPARVRTYVRSAVDPTGWEDGTVEIGLSSNRNVVFIDGTGVGRLLLTGPDVVRLAATVREKITKQVGSEATP